MSLFKIAIFTALSASVLAGLDFPPVKSSRAAEPASQPLVPSGLLPPQLRVSGARSSAQLSTIIHCSNVDSVSVSIYVAYWDFDNTFRCSVNSTDMPVGTTRSFSTADSAAFLEDAICAPTAPAIGQGRVEIATFPLNAKITCSAQVVSTVGNPPATLSSLDIYRAN